MSIPSWRTSKLAQWSSLHSESTPAAPRVRQLNRAPQTADREGDVVYDGLTARYAFSCPATGQTARVRLSAFRTVERLPGSAHPAVYDVTFACPLCRQTHQGLAPHDELDWAPVSAPAPDFYNVMTGRLEPAAPDLADHAAAQIRSGRWPWCFYCYLERRPQPVFPSAFRLVVPGPEGIVLGAGCPGCDRTSVNVVSEAHLDVPFYSDREIGVVEDVFSADLSPLELADALASRADGATRLRLAA